LGSEYLGVVPGYSVGWECWVAGLAGSGTGIAVLLVTILCPDNLTLP
jgi:hypothetical protein